MKRILDSAMLIGFIAVLAFSAQAAAPISTGGNDRVNIGGSVTVNEGETVENAVAVMGDVTVNGTVNQDAVAVLGGVRVGPAGRINGDLVSVLGNITLADGAWVGGSKTRINPFDGTRAVWPFPLLAGGFIGLLWLFKLLLFLGFLALAVLLVALLPDHLDRVSDSVVGSPLRVLLAGCVSVLLVAPVCIALVLTIIGIPLIPLGALLFAGAVFFGYLAVARIVGQKVIAALYKKPALRMWEMLLGVVLLWLVGYLPVAGFIIRASAALLGLGAVVYSVYGAIRKKPAGGEIAAKQ